MKNLFLSMIVVLAGCGYLDTTPKTTGPVKIAVSHFDYHETLEKPNGEQFEFKHCEVVYTLFEEGATVNITYTGDPDKFTGNCAKIVKVVFIQHSPDYIKNHPELWPDRKGHWKGNVYIIDRDGMVCGEVQANAENSMFYAYSSGDDSRNHEYTEFIDKELAKKKIEADCR